MKNANRGMVVAAMVVAFALTGLGAEPSGKVRRVFVEPFAAPAEVTNRTVAAAEYMGAFLGKYPGVFVCTADRSTADCTVSGRIAAPRSRENEFKGYSLATKTTNWRLDVIVKLTEVKSASVLVSGVYSGEYREQRPISGTQFDNNIIESLLISALDQAAEDFADRLGSGGPATGSPAALPPSVGQSISKNAATVNRLGFERVVPKPHLAIAEPQAGDGVSASERAIFWDMLESNFRSDDYELVSRSDFVQMMTEVGFTTNSDLLDQSSADKARLGRIGGVGALLVSTLGRFGTRIVCTLKVVDTSTGRVDQKRDRELKTESLDALADVVGPALREMFAGPPEGVVLLPPRILVANPPAWLADELSARVGAALSQGGVVFKRGDASTPAARYVEPTLRYFTINDKFVEGSVVFLGSVSGEVVVKCAAGDDGDVLTTVPLKMDGQLVGSTPAGAVPAWLRDEKAHKVLPAVFTTEVTAKIVSAVQPPQAR